MPIMPSEFIKPFKPVCPSLNYRIAGNFRGGGVLWLNTGARIFYPRMKRSLTTFTCNHIISNKLAKIILLNHECFDPRNVLTPVNYPL